MTPVVSSLVKIVCTSRTDELGFGSSSLRPMVGGVYEIKRIEGFGKDKMFQLNGMWFAQKDCMLFTEETLDSIKPPTLVFDSKNLF